jgi:hypothetical protein
MQSFEDVKGLSALKVRKRKKEDDYGLVSKRILKT